MSYHQVDVTDAEALSRVIDLAVSQGRFPLQGLVACAGITQEIPATDYPVADFRRVLDVNITGTFLTAQLAARKMLSQRVSASIVLIASMSGRIANKVSLLTIYEGPHASTNASS